MVTKRSLSNRENKPALISTKYQERVPEKENQRLLAENGKKELSFQRPSAFDPENNERELQGQRSSAFGLLPTLCPTSVPIPKGQGRSPGMIIPKVINNF